MGGESFQDLLEKRQIIISAKAPDNKRKQVKDVASMERSSKANLQNMELAAKAVNAVINKTGKFFKIISNLFTANIYTQGATL